MEKVGPYKILAEVGKGSTARVYRAWDEAQALEVAVKLMSARISHQELYAERVSEQVTAVNQLQHPHILPVLETGMHDGRLYLVIPFMKGGTLRSRLDDGSLPQAELWQMMRQVASALDSSQAAGISHLDIKPTNILFNRKGNAFVADYGLMQAIDVTLHASGLPGTLAYMSPELFVGGGTDGRADQYSLAIVAFESLSGQLPFSGNVTQLMFKQVHESPPLELLHDDELAQVLGQALAKKPDERFNTTSEFVMALTAAVLSVTADANMTFIMGATRAVTDSEPEPAAASVELIITPEEDEPEEASDATLIAPSPLRPLPLTTDIESEEELHLDEAPDDVLIAYDSDATMIVAPPTAPKFPEESERPPVALSELVEDDPNLFDVEATVVVVPPKPEDENEPTANEDDLPNHDATYIAKPVPAETPVLVVPPEEDGWAPSDVNATFIVEPIPDKKPERSATAAVFKPSPPPPVRSRIDEASLNRDVVVKPGAGGQTPSGFRWPLKGWHTAVIFILIAIIALALFLGRGTADIFTAAESTATIMATVPGEKKKIRVLNAEADTVWQMGDKGGLLPEDGLLPWPNEDDSLVIIADDDAATLDMPDGTQFVLAPQTKLIFDLTAADTLLDYHLSYGRLLINTNKNQITLETPLGSTASMTNGLMGIGYSESPFLFDVDCFKGPCDVTDLDIIQTLSEGERSYIGGNGLASPEPVRNELYLFSDLVAEATVTPSSTPTRTALPTKEPTATLIATAADTSTPTPSATPTLTPTETAIFLPRPRIAQYSCSAPGTFTKNQNIQFAWTWRGQLRSGEYLEVRVGAQGATNLSSVGRASSEEKQGDLWVMTISAAQFFEDRFHDYEWQVVHMSSNGRTPIVFSSRGCLHITP